jgi:hypothetical protein
MICLSTQVHFQNRQYTCTALYRTQLPLCQGHPPLCLPPRTAQRLPDRIQTMFGRAVFIQLTVVDDINAKAVEV